MRDFEICTAQLSNLFNRVVNNTLKRERLSNRYNNLIMLLEWLAGNLKGMQNFLGVLCAVMGIELYGVKS